MKQLKRRIFTLILSMCLLLLSGMTAFASGEGNIDGGGGGMGSGTATDVWHGQDGVRVTVVTADGSVASTPFDLSNANVANNVLNFGKVCKLQYSSGSSLSPNGSYSYSKPGIALPRIISGSSSRASIEAIRRYFCSEYAAQLVSAKSGIPFEELVSGSYKLVIEPIAYFTRRTQLRHDSNGSGALQPKVRRDAAQQDAKPHAPEPAAVYLSGNPGFRLPRMERHHQRKSVRCRHPLSARHWNRKLQGCPGGGASGARLYLPSGYGCHYQHHPDQQRGGKPGRSSERHLPYQRRHLHRKRHCDACRRLPGSLGKMAHPCAL